MRILFERNIATKYTDALGAESWTTVAYCDDHFPATTPDSRIAAFAERDDWVIMTLDDDFFQFRPGFGILLLDQGSAPDVSDVVAAVELIGSTYADHSNIAESVPGNW